MSKLDLDVSKLSEAQVARIFEDVWCDELMLEYWRIKVRLMFAGKQSTDKETKPKANAEAKDK